MWICICEYITQRLFIFHFQLMLVRWVNLDYYKCVNFSLDDHTHTHTHTHKYILIYKNMLLYFTYLSVCECVSIHTNLSTGSETWSILTRNIAGLNSEFSFSYIGCQIKTQLISLSYYSPKSGERTDGFMPFSRTLTRNLNRDRLIQDLNSGHRFHFLHLWPLR